VHKVCCLLMVVCFDGLEHSSVEGPQHVLCEEAATALQFRFLCSSSSTLRMNEKNVHPRSADTFLETGAS
jgi:hypothetical protein